jgi:hypothetical protein
MVTAVLVLGLAAWTTWTFSGVIIAVDAKDDFERGIGCAMVPCCMMVASFIVASIFWLYR